MLIAEAKKANIMIPYDEEGYNYFSNIQGASCLKPILPQPNKRYYEFKPQSIPKNYSDDLPRRVLMFFAHGEEELESYNFFAKAMNLVAKKFKTIKLVIIGVPEGEHRISSKKLKTLFKIDLIISILSSVDDIELELQSTHLVLIPESPGMNSLSLLLSVMAIGIPFVTKRFSPCHDLIRRVVEEEMDIESMIDYMDHENSDTLTVKVEHKLKYLRSSFNSAKTLRSLLEKSEFIKINNSEFTGKVREHIQRGTNLEEEPNLSHTDIPREEGMVKSAFVPAIEDQTEGKDDILDKGRSGNPTDSNEDMSSCRGRQTLHVEIKGGIPVKGRKMADVEKAYYNLDEHKNGVPERLNSRHPDMKTGDVNTECVKYSIICKTLEALEFLWQEYESLELNKLITTVTITDETLKKIGAMYLEIETALDIEEYYECKKELEHTAKGQVSPTSFAASEDGESVALTEKYRDLQSKHEELRTEYAVLKRQKEDSDVENSLLKISNENLEEENKTLSKIVESRKLHQPATGTEKQISHDVIVQEEDTQSVQPASKRRKVVETLKDTGSQALSEEKYVTTAKPPAGDMSNFRTVWSQEGWSKRPLSGANEGQPFGFPQGLAFVGNRLAVCDTDKSVVQIINEDGVCESELGTFDGQFPKPFRPVNVAVSKHKHYFIIDRGNLQIVVCDETSKIIKLINLPGAHEPKGITLQNEFILVTDPGGFKLIKLTIDGELIGDGCKDGYPHSVVVNSNDVILVTDNAINCIKCFDSSLNFLHKYCSPGNAEGQLLSPSGIAIDEGDNIYICNGNNKRVDKLKPNGKWECTPFEMYWPEYISVAKDGRIAVAYGGSGSKEIVIFSPC